ncbi:LuxR family transcriptional regulator [Solwaraspora sp. WMMD1047]|uniref:helix-turn-helix transcriptional regulator n=1 Tax=Solwaraspora sp. WMMD1047 TaxID=3016102 RepID=UPI0024172D48|nr:LuxR family transcriptional regulator [Solwaraspora sp. WMMD1047]MDG4830832.1 LuxR family transcriptional regulator [Solwaraspora sp. WMMD1047]
MVEELPERAPAGSPLVGRTRQVELLDAAVRRVAAGQFAVVEICGEPGVGKTRMLAELAHRAKAAGLRVCSGAGTEFEQSVPFAVYTEALGGPVEHSAGRPGGDGALGQLPGGPVSPADRLRVHAATRRQLTGSALLLDDLHWTDQASLDLTEYLIRKPPTPALIAVAYRTARPHPGVIDAIGHLGAAGFRMTLPPLDAIDLAALLPRVPAHRRALILKISNGNPLYIEALARLDDAALADLALDPGPATPDSTDGSRRQLLGWLASEITALDPPAQLVAQAAAVVGEHAAIDLLAEVAQLPVDTVVEAVDQMYRAGLIATDGPWFRFRHPLLRAAAHGLAGPAWRVAAHGRAADYLRRHGGSVHVVAHHTERSARHGDEQATETLVEAGCALVAVAPAEAARWLGAALRILPGSQRWRDRRPDILLNYARALGLSGDLRRSWEVLQELRDADGQIRAEAVAFSAIVARMRGDIEEADALLHAQQAGGSLRPAAEGRRQVELAALAALRADPNAAIDHGDQALRLLAGGQNELAAAAGALRAWGTLSLGRADTAIEYVRDAARLADAASDRALLPRIELFGPLAWVELRLGRVAAATRHLARARAIAERMGRSSALPYLLVVEAMLETRLGRLPAALQRAEEAAVAARQIGSTEMQAMADAVRLRPLTWVEGPTAAIAVARRLTGAGRPRSGTWSRIAQLDHAIAQAAAGATDRCLPLLADSDEPWPVDPYTTVCRLATRAMVLARAGDHLAAAETATRAESAADAAGLDYERGLAVFAGAYVATRAERHADAIELAAVATARFAGAGAAFDEARSRQLAARAHSRSGDDRAAAREWDRAVAGYRDCGAGWLLGTMGAAAGTSTVPDRRTGPAAAEPRQTVPAPANPMPPAAPAAPGLAASGPAASGLAAPGRAASGWPLDGRASAGRLDKVGPLTSREREIADLVATGLTNQEIASRLFLSRRTVESHVARIFTKLDVRSRVSMANLINRSG